MEHRVLVSMMISTVAGSLLVAGAPAVSAADKIPVWAPRANAICAKAQIDVVHDLQAKRIDPSSPAGASRAFLAAEGVYRRQMEALRKLPTNDEERKKLDKVIKSLDDALTERKKNLAERKVEKQNPFDKATKQARELGLSCRF